MLQVTQTELARSLSDYMGRVLSGETVEVSYHGKVKARISPVSAGMSGAALARSLQGHKPDPEAADAIAAALKDYERGFDFSPRRGSLK